MFGITVVTVSPILIVRKMLTFFSLWYKRESIQSYQNLGKRRSSWKYRFCTRYGCRTFSTEVGYWIGEPFWNQGIVTDALKEAINYYFRTH